MIATNFKIEVLWEKLKGKNKIEVQKEYLKLLNENFWYQATSFELAVILLNLFD